MEHVAIDLGRPNSVLCEPGPDGKKQWRRFRLDRPTLIGLFAERPHCRVLIEASTESEWVALLLEELGHEVVVADPNYAPMYGERNRKVKTDNRDAAALLDANRLGIYRPAHRRSTEQARIMGLLSVRDGLIKTRTCWINLVRAQLRRAGFKVRSGAGESFVSRVREIELPVALKALIEPLLALMPKLNEQLAQLDREMAQADRRDPRVELLQTAPQVGPQTAVAFVALIDEVTRFPKAHRLESYLGVVPSEWTSSEQRIQGGITKRGDSRVRYLLVEAPGPSCAARTRSASSSSAGPRASPAAAAPRSRSWPWLAAWPASSTPCCATTTPSTRPASARTTAPAARPPKDKRIAWERETERNGIRGFCSGNKAGERAVILGPSPRRAVTQIAPRAIEQTHCAPADRSATHEREEKGEATCRHCLKLPCPRHPADNFNGPRHPHRVQVPPGQTPPNHLDAGVPLQRRMTAPEPRLGGRPPRRQPRVAAPRLVRRAA